ncbi:tyrosine-type recombinase/integrase [Actinokineospora enzanensis]|uniref:tyrosine-type recombinase/integrase n=1 Tax=Actinokineospora enzanensis TaxID=155975 RepID=UPI00036A477D|nr:tyrosine-type recombinase/integrase [Actinokineospora enzanensis]
MAGHVEDRWYKDRKDATGNVIVGKNGRPLKDKTALHGTGMRYRVRYYADGSERSKSFPDRSLGEAEKFLALHQVSPLVKLLPASKPEEKPEPKLITFRDYTTEVRKGRSKDPIAVASVDTRLNTMVLPYLGDVPVQHFTTSTMREWLDWSSGRGVKDSYRAQIFDTISGFLQAAVFDGLLERNPCKADSVRRPVPEEYRPEPWPREKCLTIRSGLPPEYRPLMDIALRAGHRQMEALAFSPDDMDRNNLKLHIQRQIRWINGKPVFGLPKRRKTREVFITEDFITMVDDHTTAHEPYDVTLPWLVPDGDLITVRLLVPGPPPSQRHPFPPPVWRGNNFARDIWVPAFQTTATPYRKRIDGFHALRHTFASNLLAHGVSLIELANLLGHLDPAFTARTYTHLIPESPHRIRRAMTEAWLPSPHLTA